MFRKRLFDQLLAEWIPVAIIFHKQTTFKGILAGSCSGMVVSGGILACKEAPEAAKRFESLP
jgi:hypothetical protein